MEEGIGILDGPTRKSSACLLRRCDVLADQVLADNPDENSVVTPTVDDDPVVVFSSPASQELEAVEQSAWSP